MLLNLARWLCMSKYISKTYSVRCIVLEVLVSKQQLYKSGGNHKFKLLNKRLRQLQTILLVNPPYCFVMKVLVLGKATWQKLNILKWLVSDFNNATRNGGAADSSLIPYHPLKYVHTKASLSEMKRKGLSLKTLCCLVLSLDWPTFTIERVRLFKLSDLLEKLNRKDLHALIKLVL